MDTNLKWLILSLTLSWLTLGAGSQIQSTSMPLISIIWVSFQYIHSKIVNGQYNSHTFQIQHKSKMVDLFLKYSSEVYIYFRFNANLKWSIFFLSPLQEVHICFRIDRCLEMFRTAKKCLEMLGNVGNCLEILGNNDKCWEMLKCQKFHQIKSCDGQSRL